LTVRLNTNLPSLNAQRRLAEATSSLQRSFERLSSGLRISHVSDDAAGLSIASLLKVDSRVLSQGVRNLNDGISLLNISEGAAGEVSNVIVRLRELAFQASNGVLSNTQRTALNQEAQALRSEYNRIVETTNFNGMALFDPGQREMSFVAGYSDNGQITLRDTNQLLRHAGDGTYQAGVSFAAGVGALRSIDTGDVNGDGIFDLVGIDYGGATSVLIGNGDGTFRANSQYLGGNADSIRVILEDFNGDSYLDAAIASRGGISSIRILAGNGNGTFRLPPAVYAGSVGGGTETFSVHDLNGDGHKDVIVQDTIGRMNVLFGNGNGSFRSPVSYVSLGSSMVLSDLNADGVADAAFANTGTTALTVMLGNTDGSFRAYSSYALAGFNEAIYGASDINNDGLMDILAGITGGASTHFEVYFGNGDGTLRARVQYNATGNIASANVADVNDDGYEDIVTTLGGTTAGAVHFGNADGTFRVGTSFTAPVNGMLFHLQDVTDDGVAEIVGFNSTTMFSLLGNYTEVTRLEFIDLTTKASALAATQTLEAAADRVSKQRGVIGAGQSRLQTAIANTRGIGANSEEAASRILDADVAQESSRLVRVQILQQAAQAVLAQANVLPELALRLLS